MFEDKLQNLFIKFCKINKFEINNKQVKIINLLDRFIYPSKSIFNYFFNPKDKFCFYLHGNVGVGKTMLLNFVYDQYKKKKIRLHFNEFMINFHDFRHKNKDNNSIIKFVKMLKKKFDLIYLDEFQVTNIVDAMILGKLFELIFSENIKIIITTNIKLKDLYKEGLQREQFLPFISIIQKYSIQKELLLNDDFRLQNKKKFERVFYPLDEKTFFKISKNFRELTKDRLKHEKTVITKGRPFKITNFYSGIARFNFIDLCDENIGAEDYINISAVCDHIFIEEIPNFNDTNSNQQLRFITLIDVLYEKKITLTISIANKLTKLVSSKKHIESFKRTVSRLHEMTKDI
jgi:cell division protein ZapE